MRKIPDQLFRYIQVFFYLALVFLWFKDNFPPLRSIQASFLWALVPLAIVTVIRMLSTFKQRRTTFKLTCRRETRVILVVILLAVLLRIPFLAHIQGFNDGDDGLIIMQAKHLAEGERPSVYNYGVAYESSTLMHIYALLFKVFGYSILALRLTALTIFVAFIVLQFHFLQEIFSTGFALFVSLFYCLPIGHTMITSLNLSGDFPSVLFLGSLSVYLSYLIHFKDKECLIPFLGFFMGLAFWVHQMTAAFLVTSFLIFALKYKFRLKKYLHLASYGIIGAFPVVLSEVMTRFSLLRFLLSGKGGGMDFGSRVKRSVEMLSYLLSRHFDSVGIIFLGLLFLSFLGIVVAVIRNKKRAPLGIFIIFSGVFFLVYFLSKFSAKQILSVRYFYPLYFVLPVILFAFMAILRAKVKYVMAAFLLLGVCVSHNLSEYFSDISLVKQAHVSLKHTVSAIEGTGERCWTGDFWDSFLITTLSGERVISYYHTNPNYYPPYFFAYFNSGKDNNNFLFLKQAGMYALAYREMLDDIRDNMERKLVRAHNLMRMLDRFGVGYRTMQVDDNLLVFSIQEDVPPIILTMSIPETVPELELDNVQYSDMHLVLTFRVRKAPEIQGFRLRAEIAGYSSSVIGFSPDHTKVTIRLPFPEKTSFTLTYYLDYKSVKIAPTVREVSVTPSPDDMRGERPRIMFLTGFGPRVDMFGKRLRICEKVSRIEIATPAKRRAKVRLYFYSPFDFSHPMWQGKQMQSVKLEINHIPRLEADLKFGKNIIEIDVNSIASGREVQLLTMTFDYHVPLKGTSIWKTSALLEKVELE